MRVLLLCILLSGFTFFTQNSYAQASWDTAYYDDYTAQLTTRFYFSQKYVSLLLDNDNDDLDLTYRPNTTFNMGIGASYDWFTLNLAYGFGFLNQDEDRGETDYLDLQAHFYGQKVNLDLFGEFYNGFYLTPEGKASTDGSFYLRPDLKVTELGVAAQYIFNDKKVSFRAAALQNQRQKKSAGSLLVGAEFYFGLVRADSSVYPSLIAMDSLNHNQADYFEFGPNVGYMYTFVFFKNFFITASIAANLDYGVTNYYNNNGSFSEKGLSPNAMFRAFAGWNTPKNAVSLVFTNNNVSLTSPENTQVGINTGNFRINYVRRFIPGPKTEKLLKPIKIFK